MSKTTPDIVVIGAGPAGYTAAIYAVRAGYRVVVVTGGTVGGQLATTTDVENYPGFATPILGPDLMHNMHLQAEAVGAEFLTGEVTAVDFSQLGHTVTIDDTTRVTARAVIIATGAQSRWLGLESEQKLRGYGVSSCATCDGFFFRGQKVAVIGGGNSAMEEALFLCKHASEVTVIHRRDRFRAEAVLQDRLMAQSRVSVIWNHVVVDILPSEDSLVRGIVLESTKTRQRQELAVAAVFIAIGHIPATSIFRAHIACDAQGYIIVQPQPQGAQTQTSAPGVFAAGDVCDSHYRQAVTAAGMGCMAALDASHYLQSRD